MAKQAMGLTIGRQKVCQLGVASREGHHASMRLSSPPSELDETPETPAPRRRDRLLKPWLVGTQCISFLTLLPWLAIAPFSAMAFDAGFSVLALLIVLFVLLYPVVVIGGAMVAWGAYRAGNDSRAYVATTLPFGYVILWFAITIFD